MNSNTHFSGRLVVAAFFLTLSACSGTNPFTSEGSTKVETVPETKESIVLGTGGLTTKRPINPSDLEVTVVNTIPGANYLVEGSIVSTLQIAEPLDIESMFSANTQLFNLGVADPCADALKMFGDNLKKADSEEDIATLRRRLNGKLDNKCTEEKLAAVKADFDATTSYSMDRKIRVNKGEDAVINITRTASGKILEKKFPEIRFETKKESPGQWLTYYGFNYIDSDDREFFSQSNPMTDPQTYTITKKSSTGGYDFAPSLYFMFVREQNHENNFLTTLSWNHKDWLGGLTAGVGFDFDSPTVFLGYGVGYGYNVMVNAGFAMRKVDRLEGKYETGQIVLENLSAEQLATTTYEPGFYIGLSFRFGSNPFQKKSDKPEPKMAAPAPTPASKADQSKP